MSEPLQSLNLKFMACMNFRVDMEPLWSELHPPEINKCHQKGNGYGGWAPLNFESKSKLFGNKWIKKYFRFFHPVLQGKGKKEDIFYGQADRKGGVGVGG